MTAWGMAAAKAKLGEVVHEAETTGPQVLTRSGRQVAMIVSIKEWKEMRDHGVGGMEAPSLAKESMADFFMRSPLRNSGLKIPRLPFRPRKLDL